MVEERHRSFARCDPGITTREHPHGPRRVPGDRHRHGGCRPVSSRALAPRLAAFPGVQAVSLRPRTYQPACAVGRASRSKESAYEKDRDYPSTQTLDRVGRLLLDLQGRRASGPRLYRPTTRRRRVPVVIVNQSFVRKHFASENPLGRRIRLGGAEVDAAVAHDRGSRSGHLHRRPGQSARRQHADCRCPGPIELREHRRPRA